MGKTNNKVIREPKNVSEKEEITKKEVVCQTKEYKVLLSAPTYYIIDKNGVNVTIKGQNNYKKGDIVKL